MEEKKAVRLEGVRLRDEYVCPILHELLREPVVAGDGYTYEKDAIEKWFITKDTSPLTRVSIPRTLTPNLTLKKLIQDLINEGATGLYATDSHGRVLDVCAARVLTLRCLGPPDATDWYRQSFQVTPRGCIGGRRPNHSNNPTLSRDIVTFKDTTVSRRHFEIFLASPGQYAIRDLASAGGTFIRVLHGQRKELLQGMIVMLGKHQFVISSMCSIGEAADGASVTAELEGLSLFAHSQPKAIPALSHMDLKSAGSKPARCPSAIAAKENIDSGCKEDDDEQSLETCSTPDGLSPHRGQRGGRGGAGGVCHGAGLVPPPIPLALYDGRCCVITCCAPDGSPLVGRSFSVGSKGGTLGRDPSCTVPLCRLADPDSNSDGGSSALVKLDSAISAEHARIVMDFKNGKFYLLDGTPTKPSTNGTWFRLSGPVQESAPFRLNTSDEVLFGTLRFLVTESMTISEQEVQSP